MPIRLSDIPETKPIRLSDIPEKPVRLRDLADQWLRPESVGLLPGPEPPSIEDYFGKQPSMGAPQDVMSLPRQPVATTRPPYGFEPGQELDKEGFAVAPKNKYQDIIDNIGLSEIGKSVREMAAPTTPYTEKEAKKAYGEIPRTLENIGVRLVTLGGLAGPLMGLKPSQLRAAIDEDAREGITSGLAPALAPATADTAILAVQWGYIYPKLFAAAGTTGKAISKIPQVAKGMKALKAMGGIDKIATKYPRLYNTATNAISSFTKGATVGGVTALPETLGEELPAGEVIRHVGKSAAILGGVAMTFSLASEVDTRSWTNKFRKTLLEAHNKQFDKAIAGIDAQKRQYMAMPDIPEYRAAKAQGLRYIKETTNSLGAEKIRQLKAIDGRVATAEAQLRSMKSDKLYKQGQELIEKPDIAARRNIESLKIGLGKSKPFIEMPTTRTAEAVETVKGVAGAIRHPVKAIGEATRPTRPPLYVPPTIPQTGVVTPPPVAPPVQVPPAVTPTEPLKEPEATVTPAVGKGEVYKGKAFRTPTGTTVKGTAADVVRFEQDELGNDLGVSEEQLKNLETRPASDIVWVTREKVEAARYAQEDVDSEVTADDLTAVEEVDVVGGEIIADIGADGVLVLKPTPAEAKGPKPQRLEDVEKEAEPTVEVKQPVTPKYTVREGNTFIEVNGVKFPKGTQGTGMRLPGGMSNADVVMKFGPEFDRVQEMPIENFRKLVGLEKPEVAGKDLGKKPKAKDEYKVGDVINTKGKTNMADPIIIRAIEGNTLKFTDAEGVEYSGMARSQVRNLINGGSWERVTGKVAEKKKPTVSQILSPDLQYGEDYRAFLRGEGEEPSVSGRKVGLVAAQNIRKRIEAEEKGIADRKAAKAEIPKKKLEQPPADVVELVEEKTDEQKERKRPGRTGTGGEGPLEKVPSETVSKPEKTGDSVRSTVRSGGTGEQLHAEGTGSGGGLSRSEGVSSEDVDTSTRRGPTGRRKSESSSRRDYRITEADQIGKGGKKAKFKSNLAAIKLLKQIESENRPATQEEQAILVKYVGWGGLVDAVPTGRIDEKWATEVKQLKDVLTEEEYAAAKASAPNAHYTSFETIGGIWDGLYNLGVAGGKINEPSMGVGHFYGLMPDKIAANSKLYGVELDSISGRIAQQLYQSATIQIKGFEKVKYPDNYFDMFISNVPFGDYKVFDEDLRTFKGNIHDFFFAKALKKTRPGGLVVFITSKGTLDKVNPRIRSYLASQADLIGAIRLPDTAFKENAGTEVVTDIVILQKRDPSQFQGGETFKNQVDLVQGKETFKVNEYFARNPGNILGKLSYTGTMYRGEEMTVEPKAGVKLGEEIRTLISGMKLTEQLDARQQKINEQRHSPDYSAPAPDHVKEGAYALDNKKRLRRNVGGELIPVDVGQETATKIKTMVKVRDALRTLIHKQLDENASDAEIEQARKELNKTYKIATSEKPLSDPYSQRIFKDDPDLPMLLSLETYDPDTKKATARADIFTKRTQTPYKPLESAETAEQSLIASLNEKGRVDLDYMSRLLGESIDKVIIDLEGQIYLNPAETKWEPADLYLSGNVRRKLKEAEDAAAVDKKFEANVKALKEVQPEDVKTVDIDVRLGASWVEAEDYHNFFKHLSDSSGYGISFSRVAATGGWVVDKKSPVGWTTPLNVTWGTDQWSGFELMVASMNQKQPKVWKQIDKDKKVLDTDATMAAQLKQQAIKDEFKKWLWEDMDRATRLSRKYNDMFNTTVFAKWDGSHLKLPGKVDAVKMRPHQLDAIWRILTQGNTLLAHVVGSGKTYTGVAVAMEARRMGKVKKPIFVVPNHLVTQWRDAWMELYPSATILAASGKDFTPKNRQTMMNKISTGDWDGVIVPFSSFELIPISPEITRQFFAEQMEALERDIIESKGDKNKNLTKELEKAKLRLKSSLEKQEARWKKDKGPFFDEIGIDMMFVDEAQEYKNLFFRTQMTRVAGIQQAFAQKTFDMEMKAQYINKITNNKGLVFATGTPITNTIAEMFTMQRYLQPELLKEAGIDQFDSWVQSFGEAVTGVEVAPDGSGFRINTRFSKFTNLPELMQMFRTVTDIQTQKMINLKVPKVKGGKATVIQAPESPALKAFVATLVARAEAIHSGGVRPDEDNMLNVVGDGRKAALDMRLVSRHSPKDPTAKVQMIVDKVHEIWERTAKERDAQVIWLDLSTPKKGQWSIYNEIKADLIKKGIPASEIAFVHDIEDKKLLNAFYSKVNDGRVRIVLASTKKMGTGANIQQRLIASHHADAPWRPADIEQRDGRIIRPGNKYDEVEIYRYVTKGSFDAYMWQTLEIKAKFIGQVMSGETTSRETDDVGETILSYAEVKGLAAGNPKVMEAVRLDSDVKHLQAAERSHREQQFGLRQKHARLPGEIDSEKKYIASLKVDIERYEKARAKAGDDLDIVIDGEKYTKRKEAGEALNARLDKINKLDESGITVQIGSAYGFKLQANWYSSSFDRTRGTGEAEGWFRVFIEGERDYQTNMEDSPVGNITRIINTLEGITSKLSQAEARLKQYEKELVMITEKIGVPFEKNAELEEKKVKLAQIHTELQSDAKGKKKDSSTESGGGDIGDIGRSRAGTSRIKVSMEPAGKVQTATEIVTYIERAFNIPMRGVATHHKKYAGWFDPKAVGIRMKDVRALTTAMHEIGHHIDWTLNNRLSKKPPNADMAKELMALGKALYGKIKPPGGYKSEGWAEFIREYLTGDEAETKAPAVYKWFKNEYLPGRQDIDKKLNITKKMITNWRLQGAEARIESQISRKPAKGTMFERIKRSSLWAERAFRSELEPIRRAMRRAGIKEMRSDLDPYQIAVGRADKAGAIARFFVENYTTDLAGNRTGKGLKEIIKPVAREIKAFTRWIVAAQARIYHKKGLNPGISSGDANYVYEKYDNPQWQETLKEITEWNHRLLDYLVEAGGMEKKTRAIIEAANPIYIPFMREFLEGELNVGKGIGKGVAKTAKAVKKRKGSGRAVIDPFESMIQQAAKIIGVAHKTQVAVALAKLSDKKGTGGMIWKVPAPTQATQFEAEQLKKEIARIAYERMGLDPDEISSAMLEHWDEILTVYTNASQYYGKDNIVSFVIDGKRQFYEVEPNLYRAIQGLDLYILPKFWNFILGKPTRALRLGATGLNAAFGLIRNFVRDAMTFTVLSKHAKAGPLSAVRGIVADVARTEGAQRFKALGGKMSAQILADRRALQHLKKEILVSTIKGKVVYTVAHPVDALRELFGVTEAGTRIGEFIPALRAAEEKYGKGSVAASLYALNAAQDVTTNFSRHGQIGKVLNQTIPFFNAAIQGPDKILRTLKERPWATLLKAIASLTIPAIWLWWRSKDEEWYKEMPPYERNGYLHFRIPSTDTIIRLPVPFELGHIFQSAPVAALDAMYRKDPKLVTEMLSESLRQANPADWPALAGPIVDVIANRDFAGRPVIPASVEGMMPEDQYKIYTSRLMKLIGKTIGYSPAKLEYLVNSYSGGLYSRVSRSFDLASKKEITLSDWPVLGTLFMRESYAPKQSLQRFYERTDALDRKYQSDKASIPEMVERKGRNKARTELSALWKQLQTVKDEKGRKHIYTQMAMNVKQSKKPLSADGIKDLFEGMDVYKLLDVNTRANKTEKKIAEGIIKKKLQNKAYQIAQEDVKPEEVAKWNEYVRKYNIKTEGLLLDRYVNNSISRRMSLTPRAKPGTNLIIDQMALERKMK